MGDSDTFSQVDCIYMATIDDFQGQALKLLKAIEQINRDEEVGLEDSKDDGQEDNKGQEESSQSDQDEKTQTDEQRRSLDESNPQGEGAEDDSTQDR